MRMKVVILVTRINSGGLSSVAVSQLHALKKAEFQAEIIELTDGYWLDTLKKILWLLSQRKNVYFITHGFVPDLLGFVLRTLGRKVSATVHAYLPEHVCYDYRYWSVKGMILKIFWRAISKHEDNIFLTRHMRDYYAKYNAKIISKKSAIIQNFYQNIFDRVNCSLAMGACFETLSAPMPLDYDKIYIAVAGNSFRKGCDKLEHFCKINPRFLVLNFGCTDFETKISNLINLPQCVDWHKYLSMSSGLLHMSRAEGQPLAVIETLMCGKPALVSLIPGHVDLIEKFASGVYCQPGLIELVPHSTIKMSDDSFIELIRRVANA
jgi:glycosyltransferase involved in cell wall biosynthesis